MVNIIELGCNSLQGDQVHGAFASKFWQYLAPKSSYESATHKHPIIFIHNQMLLVTMFL